MMTDSELNSLVELNEVRSLRGNKLERLYQQTGSFSRIKAGLRGEKTSVGLRVYKLQSRVSNIVDQYRGRGVNLLPFWAADYPPLLGSAAGRPLLLYIRGDREVLGWPMMAVVGSRKITTDGERKTRAVVERLVGMGVVVVSGLARGVDAVAHRMALAAGGKTVAVLAHGLDFIYPPEHRGLAGQIVESGGALVSEQPWGVRPERYLFPARNRIVVGMSLGVVVVEAALRSGSMTSANHAAEMGREVWAVPGSPGTDLLLEEGASEWK